MKNVCGRPGREVTDGSAELIGSPSSRPGGDRSRRTVQLEPDVVPGAVVAGVADHADGAVVEGEQGRGRVDVAEGGELGVALVGPGRVHLDDLPSGHPAHCVEVVDRAVPEDPAGAGDVGHRRRCGIHRGGADGGQQAQLAGLPAAALAATNAGSKRRGKPICTGTPESSTQGQIPGRVRVLGHRLLAERRHARPPPTAGSGRGATWSGGDHDRVDRPSRASTESAGVAPNRSTAEATAAGTASVTTSCSTSSRRDQVGGVVGADPAEADQSDLHLSPSV